jgi:hypothetical protein
MTDYTLLHALADGELSGPEMATAEELLRTDPIANAEYQAAVSIKKTLASQSQVKMDPKSWQAAIDRLNELDKRTKAEKFVGKYAWGMCSIIFALILSTGLLRHYSGSPVGTGDMAQYAAALQPFSRDVKQTGQDMRSWIRDVSYGAPIQIDPGFLTVHRFGQQIEEDRSTTVLYCSDAAGPLSLIVVKGANGISGAEQMAKQGNYLIGQIGNANCLCWSDKGFVITLVGNRGYQDLAKVAEGILLR